MYLIYGVPLFVRARGDQSISVYFCRVFDGHAHRSTEGATNLWLPGMLDEPPHDQNGFGVANAYGVITIVEVGAICLFMKYGLVGEKPEILFFRPGAAYNINRWL